MRRVAVPDLTATVLTLTVTGIGANTALGGGKGSKSGRRLLSVAAMFVGALIGAALVLHVHVALTVTIALLLVVAVAAVSSVDRSVERVVDTGPTRAELNDGWESDAVWERPGMEQCQA